MALFKQKIAVSQKNYDVSFLPQTRKQVFFDVLKLHWKTFLLYGLLFVLFSLPLHLIGLVQDSLLLQVASQEIVTEQEQLQALFLIRDIKVDGAILKVLGFVFLGVCLSGFVRVVRQYAWEENVFFTTDFVTGIKSNGVQITLFATIVGLLNVAVVYCFNTISLTQNQMFAIAFAVPLAFFVLIAVPVFAYATVTSSIYNNKFFAQLRMAFIVYAKKPLKTLLALVCCAVPFVAQMIPIVIVSVIGRFVSCMFSPLVFLAWYLFALDMLDETVNKEHFPSIVGKGLYVAPSDKEKQ